MSKYFRASNLDTAVEDLLVISDATDTDSDTSDDTHLLLNKNYHKKMWTDNNDNRNYEDEEIHVPDPSVYTAGASDIGFKHAEEEKQKLWQKKKFELLAAIIVGVVLLLQGVAFPFQTPHSLLFNFTDLSGKRAVMTSFYMSFAVGCLFVAPSFHAIIGLKWTVVLGCSGPLVYACTCFFNIVYIAVPGAVYAGVTQGAMLAAAGALVSDHANKLSDYSGREKHAMFSFLHGIYTSIFLSAPLFNTLIFLVIIPPSLNIPGYNSASSAIKELENLNHTLLNSSALTEDNLIRILSKPNVTSDITMDNITKYSELDVELKVAMELMKITESTCGLDSCWHQGAAVAGDLTVEKPTFPWGTKFETDSSEEQPITKNSVEHEKTVGMMSSSFGRQAVLGCYVLLAFCAMIAAWLWLDGGSPVTIHSSTDEKGKPKSYKMNNWDVAWLAMCDTLKPFLDSKQLLLIPLVIYMGAQQVIGYQIIPLAMSRCHVDPSYPLHLIMLTAIASLLAGIPLGLLGCYSGRVKLMIIWVLIQVVSIVLLLFCSHLPSGIQVILAIMWGVADATIQLQMSVVVSCLFEDKHVPAFHHLRLWQITGHLGIFLLRYFTCDRHVVLTSLVLLLCGTCLYLALEIRIRLQAMEARMDKRPNQSCLMPDYPAWIPNVDPHSKGQTLDLTSKGLQPEDALIST